MNATDRLLERMKFIRDSTFRNAASLRAIADDAVNEFQVNYGGNAHPWRSMTLAPKDGTGVLIAVRDRSESEFWVQQSYWIPEDGDGICYRDKPGWAEAEACSTYEVRRALSERYYHVLGWMPMPDPLREEVQDD